MEPEYSNIKTQKSKIPPWSSVGEKVTKSASFKCFYETTISRFFLPFVDPVAEPLKDPGVDF